MIRVLQVDEDYEFRERAKEYFNSAKDFEYVGGLEHANQILNVLVEIEPDVLLLDLNVKPQGALALLEQIGSQAKIPKPTIILFEVEAQQDSVLQKAAQLGADYCILRPVDLVVLENRIRQLLVTTLWTNTRKISQRQVKEICKRYFERMGIPPHYKGYRYLIEGIWLASLHPKWLNSVTKKLYPAIGERFNTTSSQVERTMRYALDKTWEKGDLEQLYKFFPYEIRESKGKPTNSAFIAKMVDLVGLELGQNG